MRTMRIFSSTSDTQIASEDEPVHPKLRQAAKIGEIGSTLIGLGVQTLAEQADVLGLPRSTAWTILQADHKASGLSAGVINRILAAPRLPVPVRAKVIEYIEEKSSGSYGHGRTQLRRFADGLSDEAANALIARCRSHDSSSAAHHCADAIEHHVETETRQRT